MAPAQRTKLFLIYRIPGRRLAGAPPESQRGQRRFTLRILCFASGWCGTGCNGSFPGCDAIGREPRSGGVTSARSPRASPLPIGPSIFWRVHRMTGLQAGAAAADDYSVGESPACREVLRHDGRPSVPLRRAVESIPGATAVARRAQLPLFESRRIKRWSLTPWQRFLVLRVSSVHLRSLSERPRRLILWFRESKWGIACARPRCHPIALHAALTACRSACQERVIVGDLHVCVRGPPCAFHRE